MKALKFLGVAILACSMLFVSCNKDKNYTITTKVNDAAMGTVSGGGSYAANATATLVATANPGYEFVQWQDGNKEATRKITVTKNETYTATFQAVAGGSTVINFNNTQWAAANVIGIDFSEDSYLAYYIFKTQDSREDTYLMGWMMVNPGSYTYESSEGDYMKYYDPHSIYTADEDGAAVLGCEVGDQYYQYNAIAETWNENVVAVDLNAHTTTATFTEDIFDINNFVAAGGTDYGQTKTLAGNMNNASWTYRVPSKSDDAKKAAEKLVKVK